MRIERYISVPIFFAAAFFLLRWLIGMRAIHGMPWNSFQSLAVIMTLGYLAYVVVAEKTWPN